MDPIHLAWPLLLLTAAAVIIYMILSVMLTVRLKRRWRDKSRQAPGVFNASPVENFRYLKLLFSKPRYDGVTNSIVILTRIFFLIAAVGVISYFALLTGLFASFK
jgi:hypothetical protein